MKISQPTLIPLSQLLLLPNNPRTITRENLDRLCASIRRNGYWPHRPMAVEPVASRPGLYLILDGNQRKKALGRLKFKEALCCVYTELTAEERDELILRSNINNGDWQKDILEQEYAPSVDFADIGLELDDLAEGIAQSSADKTQEDMAAHGGKKEQQPTERMAFWQRMLGDFRYPTDNIYEIPRLLTDNQPVHTELPFAPWGAESRHKMGIATYHFYVDDYRFEQLYRDPILLLRSGCRQVIEPNNSIHDQTPMAWAIYQTYRKRYLARYLQECGIQVWVDLNVSPRFEELNMLGVPSGYNAFYTRGVTGWIPTLERHWQMAQRISGLNNPNFCVYGGGKEIEAWCHGHAVVYMDEYMNRNRKKAEP